MEILSDLPSRRQYLFDAIESNFEVKGVENFWDPSCLQVVDQQARNAYMLEVLSRTASPNTGLLREVAAKLHHRKPISASNIRPLSCQPYIKKSSKGGWKHPTVDALKREVGCLLNEELAYVNPSPVLLNHSPELMLSSKIVVNDEVLHNSLSLQGYGDGELQLSYLYGDSPSEEGDVAHPYVKSPVESTSVSLGSTESSISNEVLGSSEIQLMDTLFDQSIMMGYTTHGSETWLEDPYSSMATIQSYTDDGCFINDPNIEELAVKNRGETFTHVCDGLKAAHSQGFLGRTDCHQGNDSILLPLNESNEVLKLPRIEFEENYVQSQNLVQEGESLIQGSSRSPSGCAQFCLPRSITGPSSYGNNTTHSLHVVNDGFNASPAIYTCASGSKPLDRYTDNRQTKDMHETSCVKSCCSYASEGSVASEMPKPVKSEDNMDAWRGKIGDIGSNSGKICRQYDARLKNDSMEVGLVHLLTAGAGAVARRDMQLASVILVRLEDMVAPCNNAMQRVVAFFVEALERLVKGVNGAKHATKFQGDALAAFQILHEIFPYIKFGHFTANQAILEAVQGASRVHIVDFEILEGIQWPAFMQALVSRKGGPPELRITALCRPNHEHGVAMVHRTCKRLSEFASAMRLPFSYSLLTTDHHEGITASQIEVVPGEALVVNCMVHLPHMPRHTMATVTSFLHTVQKLSPCIVTLVEEELGCSTTAATSFFSEALYHFHAICDSLEACLPSEVEARMLVERVFMAPRIDSTISMWSRTMSPCSLAYGGEVSDKYKWSTIMHSAGFKPLALSFHSQSQARLLLGLHKDGFMLEERSHHLVLGWQMKPLYAASVWK